VGLASSDVCNGRGSGGSGRGGGGGGGNRSPHTHWSTPDTRMEPEQGESVGPAEVALSFVVGGEGAEQELVANVSEMIFLPSRGNERFMEGTCIYLGILCSPNMNLSSLAEWPIRFAQSEKDGFPNLYTDARELARYKAVLHLPYSWSTLAFWEFLQAGLVVIVPSARFFLQIMSSCEAWGPWLCDALRLLYPHDTPPPTSILWFQDFEYVTSADDLLAAEWWAPQNAEMLVFFDSWEDLRQIAAGRSVDWEQHRAKVRAIMRLRTASTIRQWHRLLLPGARLRGGDRASAPTPSGGRNHLPETHARDACAHLASEAAPEYAFNPLSPLLAVRTHVAFRPFRVQWRPFDPLFIQEAFGVKVDYHFDCTVARWFLFNDEAARHGFNVEYRGVVPSRALACFQHEALLRLPKEERPTCIRGIFPPVDEEYIEYAHALQSVLEYRPPRPYVIVELGARYGTWAVRCVKALQQLYPGAAHFAYLVDWMEASAARCREHCLANGVNCRVITGGIGVGDSAFIDALSIRVVLDDIQHEIIDFLDLDIQGAELPALAESADGVMQQLVQRVRRVHIGTHSPEIQAQLKDLFLSTGWELAIEHHGRHGDGDESLFADSRQSDPSKLQDTAFGPVFVRDGILAFSNPLFSALRDQRDESHPCGDACAAPVPWEAWQTQRSEAHRNDNGLGSWSAGRWLDSCHGQAAVAVQRSEFPADFGSEETHAHSTSRPS
jgi:hypothetical protein